MSNANRGQCFKQTYFYILSRFVIKQILNYETLKVLKTGDTNKRQIKRNILPTNDYKTGILALRNSEY